MAAASCLRAQPAPPFNCSSQASGAFVPVNLTNAAGTLTLQFIPYGGTVQRVLFSGVDVVLGFDDATQYCANAIHPYFGALIGRVANRIAGGAFDFHGRTVNTPVNEVYATGGGDTLHGGWVGYDRRVWSVQVAPGGAAATLRLESPDGEEGFPGALSIAVMYSVGDDDTWRIDYEATAADDTVVAMTQHTYWNLNGAAANITEHVLTLPGARNTLAVDANLIPTGAFAPVSAQPWMDFTQAKAIGRDIAKGTVTPTGGYDNAWLYDGWRPGAPPATRAVAFSPLSGIEMEVTSDQPSLQFYSGNFLDGTLPKKADQGAGFYDRWSAIALEAQHFPDRCVHYSAAVRACARSPSARRRNSLSRPRPHSHSVHHADDPRWPTIELRAGQTYRQRTAYRFTKR